MKKLLVVGVIVLFLGVAVQSNVAMVQPEEEIIDVDNKQKENKLVDSINEIISVINGRCYVDKIETFGWWIYRDIEFADIWNDGWLHLRILLSNPFKLKLIFKFFPHRINVPLFIGFVHLTPAGVHSVWGIALGNINWQE